MSAASRKDPGWSGATAASFDVGHDGSRVRFLHASPDAWTSRRLGTGPQALHGYTRTAHDELDTTFPRLPNPTLVLYVFPHLAGAERAPVPGYVTTFPMYEQVEYALPGEVEAGSFMCR